MVRFETIDLRKSVRPLGPFDLVSCRNVMIYFDTETKRKIMKEIHGALFRGGWLLIGVSEATFDLEERFERLTVGNATVYEIVLRRRTGLAHLSPNAMCPCQVLIPLDFIRPSR